MALGWAHVRWLRDGRRVGGNRLQDLAAEPQLRLADPEADARADARRDVRGGPRLDRRNQRVLGPTRARDAARGRRAALALELAARDRGQDRQLGAVLDGRREAVEETDVVAGDVDVDEPTQRAVLVIQARAQLVVSLKQAVEHLLHGRPVDLRLG